MITNNVILLKIIGFCWECDDFSIRFNWIPRYNTLIKDEEKSTRIKLQSRQALRWKLNLMLVSSKFLSIILNNFQFNLEENKLIRILKEKEKQHKRLEQQLEQFKITNLINKNQKFDCFELDCKYLNNYYKTYGKDEFITLFSNMKTCVINIRLESFLEECFLDAISNIGVEDGLINGQLSIILRFQCHSFESQDVNNTFSIVETKHESLRMLKEEDQNSNKTTSIQAIDSIIFDFENAGYIPHIMTLFKDIYRLFEESISNVYAINQNHVTQFPWLFKDLINVETLYLHSVLNNTNNIPIFEEPVGYKKLENFSLVVDTNKKEFSGRYSLIDFIDKGYPIKKIKIIQVVDDEILNSILSSPVSIENKLEELSIAVKKLDLSFFKHECINALPISLTNLSIVYQIDLPLNTDNVPLLLKQFDVFVSFFNHQNFSNVLYFNFQISFGGIGYNDYKFSIEDLLLEKLFEIGLKNSKSLKFISIQFEYKTGCTTVKSLNPTTFSKIFDSIQQSSINGVLLDNVINVLGYPKRIGKFISDPFSLNDSGNSIFYHIN